MELAALASRMSATLRLMASASTEEISIIPPVRAPIRRIRFSSSGEMGVSSWASLESPVTLEGKKPPLSSADVSSSEGRLPPPADWPFSVDAPSPAFWFPPDVPHPAASRSSARTSAIRRAQPALFVCLMIYSLSIFS